MDPTTDPTTAVSGSHRTSFAAGVAALAMRNEGTPDDFAKYMEWHKANGPFDVLLDGANIAYFGQNRPGGGFWWPQIQSMMKLARARNPDAKILLVGGCCPGCVVVPCPLSLTAPLASVHTPGVVATARSS